MRVLIAGATGYLGQHLVSEAKRRGHWVRALARSNEKLQPISDSIDEPFIAEITDPASLVGACENIDYVISSVGITRQKDGCSYMDVDYQGNMNLLAEARSADIKRFSYVSVFGADRFPKLKIIQAKERFVEALRTSGLPHQVIRPNGFFSDMLEVLEMARKGKVSLFGSGEFRVNPIHGQDLAEFCLDALERPEPMFEVGGPEILTHNQIALHAFEALDKPAKISFMPVWMANMAVKLMRLVTPEKVHGPAEFFVAALGADAIAPVYGRSTLGEFFRENA